MQTFLCIIPNALTPSVHYLVLFQSAEPPPEGGRIVLLPQLQNLSLAFLAPWHYYLVCLINLYYINSYDLDITCLMKSLYLIVGIILLIVFVFLW